MDQSIETLAYIKYIGALENKAAMYDCITKEYGSLEDIKAKASRFYGKQMTTEMIAELHDVDMRTVRKYIQLGLIPKHPRSTDAKLLVRASDAILLDFKELLLKSKR